MKVCEILDIAFGMAGERLDDFPDKRLPLIWLNVTVAEAVKTENMIRGRKGVEGMQFTHLLTDMDQEIDMDKELCSTCLPAGVAAFLYSDRGNDYLSAQYRNRYLDGLQNAAMGCEESIYDYYGGGM